MSLRFFSLLFLALAAVGNTGCTLYSSAGRDAIEANQGGIVQTSGFNSEFNSFYSCTVTASMPSYLKEDLYILNTPRESIGYTAMATTTHFPDHVYVYIFDPMEKLHYTCSLQSLTHTKPPKTSDLINAGVSQIEKLQHQTIVL